MINKMKPLWAIQKFAVNDSDGKGMKDAIESLGMTLKVLDIPPFDYGNDITPPVYDGPVIPYGGTKFIDKIKNDNRWFCVFNDNFTYTKAVEELGDRMFNADGKFMKMKDFCPSMYKRDEYLFIRPDKDIKEFAGDVIKPDEFMQWYKKIDQKGCGVCEETDILVAPASRIDEEWRIFVVDGTVIDGSRYRKKHTLSIDPFIPCNVKKYVEESIIEWSPAPFFVMDICRVRDDLSILEIGDLHSAGWYASNKKKIIKAISDYVNEYRPVV
jgi:hypothetical protein